MLAQKQKKNENTTVTGLHFAAASKLTKGISVYHMQPSAEKRPNARRLGWTHA